MKENTPTLILHAQAKKAQLPRYFTHRHMKENTTTLILHAQVRERKHN